MTDDNISRAAVEDKTCMSYWFPLVRDAGLPVPETHFVTLPASAKRAMWATFECEAPEEADVSALDVFCKEIAQAAFKVGFPCFLRSGHTSNKHEWASSCFLRNVPSIKSQVMNIAYFSACVGAAGPDWPVWAIRELLPTMPLSWCPGYGGMPVCREFRFFVEDGDVKCWHPYWPKEALEQGDAPRSLDYEALCRLEDERELMALASAAGNACGGAWSVDLLETERGWYLTDMAEAHKSYHWENCEAAQ